MDFVNVQGAHPLQFHVFLYLFQKKADPFKVDAGHNNDFLILAVYGAVAEDVLLHQQGQGGKVFIHERKIIGSFKIHFVFPYGII